MVKPVMNLDEVEFDDVEENGIYTSSRAAIGDHIGARNLGYNLTVLLPGKVQCPFHCHHGEEEMFFILPTRWPGGGSPDHQHRNNDDALSFAVDAGRGRSM
jgi:uncharacterized cupin superfamily protein